MFLLAAASLPDDAAAEADLRQYYDANRRYFWILVLLFQSFYYSHYAYFAMARPNPYLLHDVAVGIASITISVTMLSVRSRLAHYTGLAILIAVTLWDRTGYSIN